MLKIQRFSFMTEIPSFEGIIISLYNLIYTLNFTL